MAADVTYILHPYTHVNLWNLSKPYQNCFMFISLVHSSCIRSSFPPHRAVRAIGRCAVSLERATERCIAVLLELITSKVSYVVQEGVVVMRDVFRRYPNRYEAVIAHLCQCLEQLDEPEAKAAMVGVAFLNL